MLIFDNDGGKAHEELNELIEELDPVWIIQGALHTPPGDELPFTIFSGGEVLLGVNEIEDAQRIFPYIKAISHGIGVADLFVRKDDSKPSDGTDPQVHPG